MWDIFQSLQFRFRAIRVLLETLEGDMKVHEDWKYSCSICHEEIHTKYLQGSGQAAAVRRPIRNVCSLSLRRLVITGRVPSGRSAGVGRCMVLMGS